MIAIDRRTMLAATAGAVLTGSGDAAFAAIGQPVVETALGKVRGRHEHGVMVFCGIPYAASTAGTNRFMPPQPARPWSGIRDAFSFGPSAPQNADHSSGREPFSQIEAIGEDCLSLNIFAPRGRSAGKRPVMVWLHGGGWRIGAGSAPALRGLRLARLGDVVLVTINHRLDLLGHLRIGDGDERFADAANNGVLDMIAALRWVRANAAAFGGDPGNVTIFGQSGGGSKVAALLAAEAAKGLFHKAIAQSCSGCLRITERKEAETLAAGVAAKLGLGRLSGAALQQVPLESLIAAAAGVHRPALDGRTFTRHPYDPDAPRTAAGIPLLIGNVADETRLNIVSADPAIFDLDLAEVTRRLARYLHLDSARAARLLEAYHAAYPQDRPGDLLGHVTADYSYVRNTRLMADRQASVAPVYSYMFTRRSPVRNGMLRSAHETEVPFVFGTASAARSMVGGGPDIALLEHMMITTWASFARTGDPNNSLLPHWDRHIPGSSSAMLLDRHAAMGKLPGPVARAGLNDLPVYEYGMPADFLRP